MPTERAPYKRFFIDPLLGIVAALAFGFIRILPPRLTSALGGWLARTIGPHLKITERALSNLQRAFPEKTDADITVLDPAERRTITAARLHEADYSPWEGYEAEAWPTLTVLRGKIMMQDGEFLGDRNDGQMLKRKVAEDVRSRPFCVPANDL